MKVELNFNSDEMWIELNGKPIYMIDWNRNSFKITTLNYNETIVTINGNFYTHEVEAIATNIIKGILRK